MATLQGSATTRERTQGTRRTRGLEFAALAFLIPFVVRMIPELIAWPYPLGFDTLGYYIPAMRWWINPFKGQSLPTDIPGTLRTAGLFHVVSTGFNRYVILDPFIAVKILGPMLTGLVSVLVYSYARRVLIWTPGKAMFSSLIATLYFVGLRISWELYRNMLGIVFLFAALIALETFEGTRRYFLTGFLVLMTFMSHQITGAILLGVFLLRGIWLLARGHQKEAGIHLCFSAMSAGLLLYQLYLPQVGRIALPAVLSRPRWNMDAAGYVLGFPVYCFIFLLPLALVGARLRRRAAIDFWTLSCVLLLAPPLVLGVNSIPLWFRWPLMLMYPLSFYAAEGFGKAMRFRSWRVPSGLTVKIAALGLIALIGVTSAFYLAAYPEHPFPYFSQYNPYVRYVQSSMLQNSISIQDTPSLLSAIDAASPLLGAGTVLVVHEAVYVWAVNRLGITTKIVPVKEPGYLSANPPSISDSVERVASLSYDSGYKVYTIWWSGGSSWYTMPELPTSFKLVENTGTFGVYLFNPA